MTACQSSITVERSASSGTISDSYGFERIQESCDGSYYILNVSELATRLEAMTADEIFAVMISLESIARSRSDRQETLSRIRLVEKEIERRFHGQMLTPYRDWKTEQPLMS